MLKSIYTVMYVCTCTVCTCVLGGYMLTLIVFLYHFPSYLLRRLSSLNLGLTDGLDWLKRELWEPACLSVSPAPFMVRITKVCHCAQVLMLLCQVL